MIPRKPPGEPGRRPPPFFFSGLNPTPPPRFFFPFITPLGPCPGKKNPWGVPPAFGPSERGEVVPRKKKKLFTWENVVPKTLLFFPPLGGPLVFFFFFWAIWGGGAPPPRPLFWNRTGLGGPILVPPPGGPPNLLFVLYLGTARLGPWGGGIVHLFPKNPPWNRAGEKPEVFVLPSPPLDFGGPPKHAGNTAGPPPPFPPRAFWLETKKSFSPPPPFPPPPPCPPGRKNPKDGPCPPPRYNESTCGGPAWGGGTPKKHVRNFPSASPPPIRTNKIGPFGGFSPRTRKVVKFFFFFTRLSVGGAKVPLRGKEHLSEWEGKFPARRGACF